MEFRTAIVTQRGLRVGPTPAQGTLKGARTTRLAQLVRKPHLTIVVQARVDGRWEDYEA